MYRLVRFVVIVGGAWMIVSSLPDLARYLRMRAI